jgi:phenylalanyl-tRNA synthetase alpha chain
MADIFDRAESLLKEIQEAAPGNPQELEEFRIKFLGSKGLIKDLMSGFKDVPNERKKEFGQKANAVKQAAEGKLNELKESFESSGTSANQPNDMSLPGMDYPIGSRHPINLVREEMVDIFKRIGFVVEEGPEIEDDWHNFTALGTPEDHPARDMQDTFYLEDGKNLLRTHTSAGQVRVMEKQKPPIRIITPGRVFRNETISARAHCTFHQIEGLYVDKNVTFADLKQTLYYFAKEFFGKTEIRLRPSYFPFTEPSAEVDVYWGLNNEVDYRITKGTGWLEIAGCGMVDPQVFENCGIDAEEYTGFAFGMGIERIAMLKYGIGDIRLFFENDMRFLSQFKGQI